MRRDLSLLFVVGLIAGSSACNREVPTPPEITHEPQDVTFAECGGATFAVWAKGEVPLTYQWFVDGAPVTPAIGQVSADGRRLELRAGLASDGRRVKVEVSNWAGRAMSREAVLSVTSAPGIAADDAYLYWYDLDAGTITRKSREGAGGGVIIATGLVYPAGLAARGGDVYWSDTDETATLRGSINRVSREGGTPVVLARQDTRVHRLLLDGEFVYWTGGDFDQVGSGSVRRVRVDGGASPEVLLSDLDGPFYLAVDGDHVYVEDRAGIWRIEKPVPWWAIRPAARCRSVPASFQPTEPQAIAA
jgi:hypothetical protein